jgi:hypothetical protein
MDLLSKKKNLDMTLLTFLSPTTVLRPDVALEASYLPVS